MSRTERTAPSQRFKTQFGQVTVEGIKATERYYVEIEKELRDRFVVRAREKVTLANGRIVSKGEFFRCPKSAFKKVTSLPMHLEND